MVRRSASAAEVASGFSQTTALPAASACSANSACVAFGVQTCTTSTSAESISSSTEAAGAVAPNWPAAAAAAAGLDPATRLTRCPADRTARACTPPMKPVPMIPARSGRRARPECPIGIRALLLPGQSDGEDDDRSPDHLLLAGVQTGQDQAVVDQSDQQSADEGADHRPGPTEEAGAAQDHGRDGGQLVPGSPLEAARLQPARVEHAGEAGHDAGDQ